uniref:TATA element modulatory factor 1 TATA binding domain-containing protein n=1 Tax=Rhodosorus marinus TaxID=101924 RepID=A0A7S2ZKF5_9RHOD|mmetsp:Transcript_20183/g.81102  ORF Transcript_20183/g.81102 Transcript_20183/m.81102 type:complete len:799 (+) Transcript_20183:523-2919(+)
MDFSSLLNKAGETLKHFENDFSKELGLRESTGEAGDQKEDEYNEWQPEEEEWVDLDSHMVTTPGRVGAAVLEEKAEPIVENVDSDPVEVAAKASPAEAGVSALIIDDRLSSAEQEAGQTIKRETEDQEDDKSEAKQPEDEQPQNEQPQYEEPEHKQPEHEHPNHKQPHEQPEDKHVEQVDGEKPDEVEKDDSVLQDDAIPQENPREEAPSQPQRDSPIALEPLKEENDALRRSSRRLEADLQKSHHSLLGMERKVSALSKECNSLRRQKDNRAGDAALLKEKDAIIDQIMKEGEVLSKKIADREKQLKKFSNDIGNLLDEKKDLKQKLGAAQAKTESVIAKVRKLEVSERSLKEAKEAADRRLVELGSENRSRAGMAAALEAAKAELDATRTNQKLQLEEQGIRMQKEAHVAFQQMHADFVAKEESLNRAIHDLRSHLAQANDTAGWREDNLRRELDDARKRCRMLEKQNEDLSASVSDATRPLVRQIEALQEVQAEKNLARESVERSQMQRMRESEKLAVQAREKYEMAEERITSLTVRAKSLEEQLKGAREDRKRVASELADVREEVNAKENEIQTLKSAVRDGHVHLQKQKEDAAHALSKERGSHVEALTAADEREEALKQKLARLETQISFLDTALNDAKEKKAPAEKHDSLVTQRSIPRAPMTAAMVDVDGPKDSDAIYEQDRRKTALRLMTDEVDALRKQVEGKEKALQAVAEEVVKLTVQLEKANKQLEGSPDAMKQLAQVEDKLNTMMVLYGERDERVRELEQDIADVTAMYKEQINDLLLQIEKSQNQV